MHFPYNDNYACVKKIDSSRGEHLRQRKILLTAQGRRERLLCGSVLLLQEIDGFVLKREACDKRFWLMRVFQDPGQNSPASSYNCS